MIPIRAFRGKTLAEAEGSTVTVRSTAGGPIETAETELPVGWLEISPDETSLLLWGGRGDRLWQWRRGGRLSLLAEFTTMRSHFGGGFAETPGGVVTLVSQNGMLRGLDASGNEVLRADLREPHSFYCRTFVGLPGGRLAIIGHTFSDSSDTVVTVDIDALRRDPQAVQEALRRRGPLFDRAVTMAAGPCSPGAAVAYRDPEGDEVPDDEEDLEEQGDVENFKGLYLRDLSSGALLQRLAYDVPLATPTRLGANATCIAVQRATGVDLIDRASGDIDTISAAVLDPAAMRVALPAGATVTVRDLA